MRDWRRDGTRAGVVIREWESWLKRGESDASPIVMRAHSPAHGEEPPYDTVYGTQPARTSATASTAGL